jgi:hypothetical protein
MANTQYPPDDKISAQDATQLSEHHTKPGGIAANMSPERRQEVEKKLKRKLDARCSLFVLIYIMNCTFQPTTPSTKLVIQKEIFANEGFDRSRSKQHSRSPSRWSGRRP